MNNNTINEIKLSSDVISSITEIAIEEIEGVNLPTKKIFKNSSIETTFEDNDIEITIPLVINYGIVIPEISPIVQEKVKENIEIMTGLNVVKVHLSIIGVNTDNHNNM